MFIWQNDAVTAAELLNRQLLSPPFWDREIKIIMRTIKKHIAQCEIWWERESQNIKTLPLKARLYYPSCIQVVIHMEGWTCHISLLPPDSAITSSKHQINMPYTTPDKQTIRLQCAKQISSELAFLPSPCSIAKVMLLDVFAALLHVLLSRDWGSA